MKVRIHFELSHVVERENTPPRVFCRNATLNLELPIDRNEFLSAVETLLANTVMSQVLSRLCDNVLADGEKYIENAEKSGVIQLELPLDVGAASGCSGA